MTFEPHPMRVLKQNNHPPLITLYEQKKELIERVATKMGGLSKAAAARAVEAVFASIAEGLSEDGIVTIGKWGTYTAEDLAEG